ncbi:NAD(P)-binding protein [Pseudovirgaria hyperparasitica]|uniref:NAD(P)-binding protein n=1 Tax=Pseudovirgaria hyperparasitica TaxID=470096 RepID=A0A6A6WHU2_9PEZI|nr:NAD(P)-binding protein [Pseudovirgaria hyperparasitica]KAF2761610.1 NAD(P)-binding protein [Pseudovirgaria hyperparasitica]
MRPPTLPRIKSPRIQTHHHNHLPSSRTIHTHHQPTTTHPLLPLTQRNCIITGGAGALGHAIAKSLVAAGATVWLVGRTRATLHDAALDIHRSTLPPDQEFAPGPNTSNSNSNSNNRINIIEGDILAQGFWQRVFEDNEARLAKNVDVLVNAAGVAQNGFLFSSDEAGLRGVLDTNLAGSMLAAKYVGRYGMIRERHGRAGKCIVNVGSLLGERGGKGAVAYAASKAGIHGLTRALAEELAGWNIRVNAVQPGYIESDMTKGLERQSLLEKIPAKRFGRPDEVADATMFLITNMYANNCVINLDGGLSATGFQ